MSIIAIVKSRDTWEGLAPTVDLAKFVDEKLEAFEGSEGFGGIGAYDVIGAAKNFAEKTNNSGVYIKIIDTQSSSEPSIIYPDFKEENNFELSWS